MNKQGTPTAKESGSAGIPMNNLGRISSCEQMEGKQHRVIDEDNGTGRKERVTTNDDWKEEKIDIDCKTDNCLSDERQSVKCASERDSPARRHAGSDRIYLNCNPEYRLNPSMLLYYALLFHWDNLFIILLRRFLFLYALWVLTGYLAFVTANFYNSVLDDLGFLSWQGQAINKLLRALFEHEYQKFRQSDPGNMYGVHSMMVIVAYLPILASSLQMTLLCGLFLKRTDICASLCWHQERTIPDDSLAQQFSAQVAQLVDKSPQRLLFERLKFRSTVILSRQFWLSVWHRVHSESNKGTNNPTSTHNQIDANSQMMQGHKYLFEWDEAEQRRPLSAAERRARAPGSRCAVWATAASAFPLVALLASFPIFSVWANVFANPGRLGAWPCCRKRSASSHDADPLRDANSCSQSPSLWLTIPATCLGIALFILLVVDFSVLYSQALLFLFVDVLRNSEALLPKCIFGISILLYVHAAFIRFEDDYRSLKLTVFEICQNIAAQMKETDSCCVYLSGGSDDIDTTLSCSLLHETQDGQISIPRQLFIDICDKYAPYKSRAFWCFLELLVSLSVIIFLFLVAVAFQVFSEFSAFGESMFTLATMSVPYVFGGFLKSEAHATLTKARRDREIEVLIRSRTSAAQRAASLTSLGAASGVSRTSC